MQFVFFFIGLLALLFVLGAILRFILRKQDDDDFIPKFVGRGLVIILALLFILAVLGGFFG